MTLVADSRIVREPEHARGRVEEIRDRAVGAEEAGGLDECVVEDRLVLGRDGGFDRP